MRVIQLDDDRSQGVAQREEVDDVMVLVERSLDLGRHAIIMPVQPLAGIAVEGDEVAGAEDQVILLDADVVAFGHGDTP